jgi:hypothetical protein
MLGWAQNAWRVCGVGTLAAAVAVAGCGSSTSSLSSSGARLVSRAKATIDNEVSLHPSLVQGQITGSQVAPLYAEYKATTDPARRKALAARIVAVDPTLSKTDVVTGQRTQELDEARAAVLYGGPQTSEDLHKDVVIEAQLKVIIERLKGMKLGAPIKPGLSVGTLLGQVQSELASPFPAYAARVSRFYRSLPS